MFGPRGNIGSRKKNAESLCVAAHALKSTVGIFAAEQAVHSAATLEKGFTGDFIGIAECHDLVEYEVERLCDTLMSFDMGGAQ